MNNPMLNEPSQSCDKRRADRFLNSDDYRLEDAELIAHLDSCKECQQYMDCQAAPREVWDDLSTSLKPGEFDQASSLDFSAATIGLAAQKPVAAQDVLASLAPSDDPHRLGRLGNYEVTGVVGVGGMGVVLKAIDPSLDRVVAIKVMAPHLANNENARKRFMREAKAAAAVLHPNVIPIHSVASGASLPYLVMSYIRGGSLQKRLEQEGKLPIVEALRIGSQIAAGLAAAHDQGLVHRDIKPENILMEDGVERVTITDFGLARAVDDNTVTQQGTIAGTPMYMSPEQARGEQVNQQSDLFSLGSMLYALCTGRPPYRAESSFGVMRKIIDEIPTPIRKLNPDVPSWLTAIIERLMSKEKTSRFQTAAEVHALLEAYLCHVQRPDAIPLPKISGGDRKSQPQPFLKITKGKITMTSLATAIVLLVFATLQLGGFINQTPSSVPTNRDIPLGQLANELDTGLKNEEPASENDNKAAAEQVSNETQKSTEPDKQTKGANTSKPITATIANRIQEQSAVAFREPVTGMQRGPHSGELALRTFRGMRVVDDTTIKVLKTVGPKDQVDDGALSQDGTRLAWTKSYTSKVYELELEPGKSIKIELGGDYTGPTTFSPDNKLIAIGNSVLSPSAEGEGTATTNLFDMSGKLLHRFESNFKGYQLPVFSPDSNRLVIASPDNNLQIFNVATGELLQTLDKKSPAAIAFHPNRSLLSAAYTDGSVCIWDIATGKLIRSSKSGCRELYSIDWSPNAEVLATAGSGGKCALWDNQLEKLKELELDPYDIRIIRFTIDGCRLVMASSFNRDDLTGQSVFVWSVPGEGAAIVTVPSGAPSASAVSKSNTPVYSTQIEAVQNALQLGNRAEALSKLELTEAKFRGWEYNYLLAQATRIGNERESLKQNFSGNGFHIESVAFTPDGQRLVIGSAQKPVKIWDLNKDESIDLEDSKSVSGAVAASPDGKMFSTEGTNGDIFLWDIVTGKRLVQFKGHRLPADAPYGQSALIVKSICFSPDSKQVVSAAYTATSNVHQKCEVKVWSVESGQTITNLKGPHEKSPLYITTATFSPDGKLIATGSFDKKLKVWDAATGKEIRAIEGHTNNVLSVAFSPDGNRIGSASADGTLAIWDIASGKELARLTGHTKPVFSVKFTPDGKRVVSGSWDETVKLWDTETGAEVMTLGKLRGPVLSVAISDDGQKIAAGGSLRNHQQIGEATVWDLRNRE